MIATWLLALKLIYHGAVHNDHAPLFVLASVLILGGIQMMGIGLLGELQVRHFHSSDRRAPYAVDRVLRLRSNEESLLH